MYIKFSLEQAQCIWSFGWHWPMYIVFWWRPLSTLFLWVRRRKIAIALCAPDPKSTCRIWWRLNRRNNFTAVIKCHSFLRWNFFEPQLLIEPKVEPSLNVYKFFVSSGQCASSLRFVLRPTPLRCADNVPLAVFFGREVRHEARFFMTVMQRLVPIVADHHFCTARKKQSLESAGSNFSSLL